MDAKVEQVAAELSLSGTALLMWRGYVASVRNWRAGELGAGAVPVKGEDANMSGRRQFMMDNVDDAAHGWATELLATCRRGKEYPRDLTAERVHRAMLEVAK